VQSQVDDPPVTRVPRPVWSGAAEEQVEGVDRRFPEVEPVAPGADDEGQLQRHRPFGQLTRGGPIGVLLGTPDRDERLTRALHQAAGQRIEVVVEIVLAQQRDAGGQSDVQAQGERFDELGDGGREELLGVGKRGFESELVRVTGLTTTLRRTRQAVH